MYPRSGFWCRGTSACTLVPVFGTGEHPNVPLFRFWYRGTSAKTTLLKTTLLWTPILCIARRTSQPGFAGHRASGTSLCGLKNLSGVVLPSLLVEHFPGFCLAWHEFLPSVHLLLGSWAPTGSCEIMLNHVKSWQIMQIMPWFCPILPPSAWFCLSVPDSAWFCSPEKGWKCLMPRSLRTKKHKSVSVMKLMTFPDPRQGFRAIIFQSSLPDSDDSDPVFGGGQQHYTQINSGRDHLGYVFFFRLDKKQEQSCLRTWGQAQDMFCNFQGKKKHIDMNKFGGIVPGLGGWQEVVYVVFPEGQRHTN